MSVTPHELYLNLKKLTDYPPQQKAGIFNQLMLDYFLRGRSAPPHIKAVWTEIMCGLPSFAKFNPYHDELGRFTFGPSGHNNDANEDNNDDTNSGSTADQIGLFLQSLLGIGSAHAETVEDNDERKPEEEGDPLAEARLDAWQSATATLREIDPNNRELNILTSPGWVPSDQDLAGIYQEIANVRNAQITNLLAPDGTLIGNPGTNPAIRELPGGSSAAEDLFNQLIRGATPDQDTTYQGTAYRLPDGGFLGYRPTSRSGPPTIDLKVPSLGPNIKLKFPEENSQ